MNWLGCAAILATGFAWGRLHGRRRTRADLERLGDLINAAIPFDKERRVGADIADEPRNPLYPPHA